MPHTPTIGILAGMGPKSTSPFLDLVIQECQKQYKAKNDIDFPHIIIYSLPTPFFINKKINDNDMKKAIGKGLKKLESTGVDFIAMPCNIAHKYFDYLEKQIKIPLLNIVTATTKKLKKTSKHVALFATSATIDSKIYQSILGAKTGKQDGKPTYQKDVDTLIQSVKEGQSQAKLLSITNKLAKALKKEKVDTIVIACTDITKIVKTMKGFTIIDSSEALAEETVRRYLKKC